MIRPRGPRELSSQAGIPPNVVGVHHDADRVGGKLECQVDRLAQARDHAAVGAEHRVQRLDPEPDAGLLGERHELADRVGDHPAGECQVPGAGDQPAGDEDQRVGLKLSRLRDGRAVVGERGGARVGDQRG